MNLLRHSIEISADIDDVFDMCLDVEKWPLIFPPCLRAKILKQEGNKQIIEIVAKANDSEMTWVSERIIDSDSYTIQFTQMNTSPFIEKMQGAWRLYSLTNDVLLSLEHHFSVHENVSGIVANVTTREDAEFYMTKCIHDNTERELAAIKHALENPEDHENKSSISFSDMLLINMPVDEVFDILKNAANWPSILPHCNKIDMIYDDDTYQEFVMEVMVNDHCEKIRTVRECQKPFSIDFFQPTPPALLKVHQGSWFLEPLNNHTLVTANHFIQLNLAVVKEKWRDETLNTLLCKVKEAISHNSVSTMEAINNMSKKRKN